MRSIRMSFGSGSDDDDIRNLEVINALARAYTSLFYLDLASGEVFIYGMNQNVTSKYAEQFKSIDFEGAKKVYAERDILPEDRPAYYRRLKLEYIRKRLKNEGRFSFIYRVIVPDGYNYCEVEIIRINDEFGTPKAAVIAYSNIDKQIREDQEQMRQLKNALRQAETDGLTKIYNRGGGELKLRELIASDSSGVFILFDIDGFKAINDRCGHQTGDLALKGVAAAMKRAMRDKDILVRFGGDEFVICAEGIKTEDEIRSVVDRLFAEVDSIEIETLDKPITISVGATLFPGEYGDNFDSIYSRVDAAMYVSKKEAGHHLEIC